MPTPAEGLGVTSNTQQRQQAVSECISQLKNENPTMLQEQAVAICISQADRSMGTRESRANGV